MKNRITRSSTNRMLAGVCGGLGEYFGIDSTWIRLLFIAADLFFDDFSLCSLRLLISRDSQYSGN
ncbi:PspC domain-containing protein [Companilactobacillus farciminis]|uniref:PspC domain-containing protein n=1 Tax=Companilactobacillus farciminis TaxID=1612 RepID=UPI001F2B5A8A|nr:PspC domain-containing protein [Companilactobacillus farciminis]